MNVMTDPFHLLMEIERKLKTWTIVVFIILMMVSLTVDVMTILYVQHLLSVTTSNHKAIAHLTPLIHATH